MSNVTPSENFIQQEALQFNQPVSEAAGSALGALANFLRETILPVGSVVYSMLSEAQFQSQNGSPSPDRWIIADGRNVSGSRYESLTGNSTVPDLRGVFIRGKNEDRSGSTGNPDGDLSLGTYSADKFASHNHTLTDPGHLHGIGGAPGAFSVGNNQWERNANRDWTNTTDTTTTGITLSPSGGNETAPRNVTLNPFIRIE